MRQYHHCVIKIEAIIRPRTHFQINMSQPYNVSKIPRPEKITKLTYVTHRNNISLHLTACFSFEHTLNYHYRYIIKVSLKSKHFDFASFLGQGKVSTIHHRQILAFQKQLMEKNHVPVKCNKIYRDENSQQLYSCLYTNVVYS